VCFLVDGRSHLTDAWAMVEVAFEATPARHRKRCGPMQVTPQRHPPNGKTSHYERRLLRCWFPSWSVT